MARELGVGIVGCGNISTAYLDLAPMFRGFRIRACADLDAAVARKRADQFGIDAHTVDDLLADPAIDIVLNLTIPAAHHEVSARALDAGKHVYSEKPFVLSLAEGKALARKAERRQLRIGSAPDTFLGGAHQHARSLVDKKMVGAIAGGTAFVMNHGMEHWHPNPDFFYKPGAGPVLDLGPYYIANLVQLIGPVRRVSAMAGKHPGTRRIATGPRRGQSIKVETPTSLHSLLEFENGAVVIFGASWDVWAHDHSHIELYGESGSLFLPDPNQFGGEVGVALAGKSNRRVSRYRHPFSIPNQDHGNAMVANYRGSGLADMALAIRDGRPHRCSLAFSLHVIDVATAILKSAQTGRNVAIATKCDRPEPLGGTEARRLLRSLRTTRRPELR